MHATHVEDQSEIRHRALLDSNEPPVDSDIPLIHSVVSETAMHLARLDAKIADLQFQLQALEAERRTTSISLEKNVAILSPLRRMPPEVLCEIFLWSLPSFNSAVNRVSLDANESPWVLAQISHLWRAIAVSTPRLWSLFAINYCHCKEPSSHYPLTAAKIQIQRAQTLKIHFYGKR
jgi:hypothetical protein